MRAYGLVANYRNSKGVGYKTGGGGACEVLPLRKGGGRKKFNHAEGGQKTFRCSLTQELEVLAIVMGGHKQFQPFKRGLQKVLSCLEGGGGCKKF